MAADDLRTRLHRDRYPRASTYDPEWVIDAEIGPNVLWLAEALSEHLPLQPGIRVLDLGSGKAASSIFLAREFGVTVFAVDLMVEPRENWARVLDASVTDRVFPMRADARALPFPKGYFDAVVALDSYQYFGTDDAYLREIVSFIRPGGRLGICGPGTTSEFDDQPEHFTDVWRMTSEVLHSPAWWRRHWERPGVVDVEAADLVPDGWNDWLAWKELLLERGVGLPGYTRSDVETLRADGGTLLGLVRAVARRPEG